MVPSENGNLPEYREVTGTPREHNGPHGPYWKKEKRAGQGPRASPPFPSPSRTRRRGRRPSLSLPPPGNLVGLGLGAGGGGNPTPGGSRTPLARLAWPAGPLPLLLYIRGQGGTPRHTS